MCVQIGSALDATHSVVWELKGTPVPKTADSFSFRGSIMEPSGWVFGIDSASPFNADLKVRQALADQNMAPRREVKNDVEPKQQKQQLQQK